MMTLAIVLLSNDVYCSKNGSQQTVLTDGVFGNVTHFLPSPQHSLCVPLPGLNKPSVPTLPTQILAKGKTAGEHNYSECQPPVPHVVS